VVLAVNKWDNIPAEQRDLIRQQIEQRLTFADFAPLHFISARHGSGVGELFAAVRKVYAAATRDMSTPELTRVLEAAVESHQPPLVSGRRIKLRYVTRAAATRRGRHPRQSDRSRAGRLPPLPGQCIPQGIRPDGHTRAGGVPPATRTRSPQAKSLTPRQVRKRKRLIQRNKR